MSCPTYGDILWKSIYPEMLRTNTDSEIWKKKKNPVSKGLNATSPKFSRSFFVWKSTYDKISRKSIRGCFRNVANRHDTAPSVGTVKQSSQVWNRQAICFVVGSNTSWKFHENLFTRFSVMLLANTDRENRKKDPVCVKRNIAKSSRWFLLLCPTYPENFMNIH